MNQPPNPPNDSGLRDNHTRGSVADFLRTQIRGGSKLSIVSAYFTIYAYDALKDSLDGIEHLDFLFGEPSFVSRLDPSKTEKKSFLVDGNRDRQELKRWFQELWGNETLVKDVKQDVLNYLKQLYDNHSPEFIYYKTLYHIFEKF